ncbi:g670 [Coccomyxa viridis]|uniref:G670 protein n=1 Tax=Coccomyxa viridis TaxID=1274662 RepID=A0ABP1FIA6_9CHLO
MIPSSGHNCAWALARQLRTADAQQLQQQESEADSKIAKAGITKAMDHIDSSGINPPPMSTEPTEAPRAQQVRRVRGGQQETTGASHEQEENQEDSGDVQQTELSEGAEQLALFFKKVHWLSEGVPSRVRVVLKEALEAVSKRSERPAMARPPV